MISTEQTKEEISILDVAFNNAQIARQKSVSVVINLGLFFNTVLACLKVFAGIVGHSRGLLADGINSVSDVVYLLFVKLLVSLSGKPADEEHPYGHYQFESIAAVVIGAFIITTGIAIFWDAINSFFDMITKNTVNDQLQLFTLYVALFTIVSKIFLFLNAITVSKKTGNIAVKALAMDHVNDIFASVGATIGIIMALFGVAWVDPIAGGVVAIFIMKTGVNILRESTAELMDTLPNNEMAMEIRKLAMNNSAVLAVESIHIHKFGPYFMANVTVGVDGNITVIEGDRIADEVELQLCRGIELLRKVYIHYHPAKANT